MDRNRAATWARLEERELPRTATVSGLMRASASLIVFIVARIVSCPVPSALAQGVNARAGDASWVAAYGREPTPDDSETDRIQTHLLWVVDQLSAAGATSSSPSARERRTRLLDSLRAYADARRFPRVDRVQRTPRFVDDRGVLCAVGHLIQESGHPELVESVRRSHEYDRIEEMHVPALEHWAASHGFDLNELALIQPAYRAAPPDEPPPVPVHVHVSGASADLEVAVRRAIRRRTPALRVCYERVYPPSRRSDSARAAQVRFQARLGADGAMAEVSSPHSDDLVVGCLTRQLRSVRIPPPETDELPALEIAIVFGPDAAGTLPALDRAALTRLLEEQRSTIEACAREDHAVAYVSVRVVVRAAGGALLRSRSEPRSPSAEACIDVVLRRVAQRAAMEFRVEATTRARARWRVLSRARRRALGIGAPSDARDRAGAE